MDIMVVSATDAKDTTRYPKLFPVARDGVQKSVTQNTTARSRQ
jgi:hypothetical protein